jgi:ElaB/YqjD/DUF883 family membrane-anchored ribosome-binding protein
MTQKSTTKSKDLQSERDKLMADLKILVADAKSLTEATGDESKEFLAEKAEDLRQQLSETMEALRVKGEKVKEVAIEKTDEVEDCIRKNPWKSIGIAVVAGIVIDRLTSRQ